MNRLEKYLSKKIKINDQVTTWGDFWAKNHALSKKIECVDHKSKKSYLVQYRYDQTQAKIFFEVPKCFYDQVFQTEIQEIHEYIDAENDSGFVTCNGKGVII